MNIPLRHWLIEHREVILPHWQMLAEAQSLHLAPAHGYAPEPPAEAAGERMCVEIIGHAGRPVRVTVKSIYLHPMPPSLFDGLESTH